MGPGHVSELLRVFMGEEIAAAADALPAEVANPIKQRALEPTPLPGDQDDGFASAIERTRTLTVEVPTPEGEPHVEPTRGAIPSAVHPDEPTTIPRTPEPTDAERRAAERAAIFASLPHFDDGPDEATVEASGHEIADFLQRIRADAAASGRPLPPGGAHAPYSWAAPRGGEGPVSGAVPPTQVLPNHGMPSSAPSAQPSPPSSARPSRPRPARRILRWVINVLLITVVAFGLGAGFAVVWVRWLS